jgi:hypothetical protein
MVLQLHRFYVERITQASCYGLEVDGFDAAIASAVEMQANIFMPATAIA